MIKTSQFEMQFVDGQWRYISHKVSDKLTMDAKVVEGEQKGTLLELQKVMYGYNDNDWLVFIFENDLTAPSTLLQTFWKLEAGQNADQIRQQLSNKSYLIGSPYRILELQYVDQLSDKEIRSLTTDDLDPEDELKQEEKYQEHLKQFNAIRAMPETMQLEVVGNLLQRQREKLNQIDDNPDFVSND